MTLCPLHHWQHSLRHPNVIFLYGGAWTQGADKICLVLEFAGRGSLDEWIGSEEIEWWSDELDSNSRGHAIALDVARGLTYLHGRSPPLVHRDVKPDNVMLVASFAAKIADFGESKASVSGNDKALATIVGESRSICGASFAWLLQPLIATHDCHLASLMFECETRHAGLRGASSTRESPQMTSKLTHNSPPRQAPEVMRMDGYSTPADVFSFGLILLEVVTGVSTKTRFESIGIENSSISSWHASENRLDLESITEEMKADESLKTGHANVASTKPTKRNRRWLAVRCRRPCCSSCGQSKGRGNRHRPWRRE